MRGKAVEADETLENATAVAASALDKPVTMEYGTLSVTIGGTRPYNLTSVT